jgi:hypothetical protein
MSQTLQFYMYHYLLKLTYNLTILLLCRLWFKMGYLSFKNSRDDTEVF